MMNNMQHPQQPYMMHPSQSFAWSGGMYNMPQQPIAGYVPPPITQPGYMYPGGFQQPLYFPYNTTGVPQYNPYMIPRTPQGQQQPYPYIPQRQTVMQSPQMMQPPSPNYYPHRSPSQIELREQPSPSVRHYPHDDQELFLKSGARSSMYKTEDPRVYLDKFLDDNQQYLSKRSNEEDRESASERGKPFNYLKDDKNKAMFKSEKLLTENSAPKNEMTFKKKKEEPTKYKEEPSRKEPDSSTGSMRSSSLLDEFLFVGSSKKSEQERQIDSSPVFLIS